MTKITIYKDSIGNIRGYKAEGHTEFDDLGKDILCSAISITTQSPLISLENVCSIEKKDIEYIIYDGYLEVKLMDNIDDDKLYCANIILKSMVLTLESLEYPEHVSIVTEEV